MPVRSSLRFAPLPRAVRVLAAALALAGIASAAQARSRIDLDGDWQFRLDPKAEGEAQGWARRLPDGTETVTVPHTWNTGSREDDEGMAWYFRSFTASHSALADHAELHFAATFYRSRVWLNGEELGGHEGGHTPYFFDVTKRLRRTNFLAVLIDNRPGDRTIPGWAMRGRGADDSGTVWYDWWHYGGIVRDVWLALGDPILVRRQQIRAIPGAGAAQVVDRLLLENHAAAPASLTLTVSAYAPGSTTPAARASSRITLEPGTRTETVELHLEAPRLWHFDHPDLYRMVAELVDPQGDVVDSTSDEFGVRSVEIRDRRLYLNGERVRLTGVARHEETAREGLAASRATFRSDYEDLKDLQVTLTRPVHYPQDPAILEYCDRNGILLIPEIPVWQFSERQMSDPAVVELAKRMLKEMIDRDSNHPSVIAWSLCNESATTTAGGVGFLKTLSAWAKSLDPGRLVTYADDQFGRSDRRLPAADHADFLMMNEYYGTWHGTAEELRAALDRMDRLYPDKMVVVSEFGFPGVFAEDAAAADRRRVDVIREQLAEFGRHDFIGGAIFWCYQDYRSHRNVWPGETSGWVDHGLVDKDRQRRPSYFAWQAANSPLSADVAWKSSGPYPSAPVGFRARISGRSVSEIPSYVLRGYTLRWVARDGERRVLATGAATLLDVGPAFEVSGDWTAPTTPGLTLVVTARRPTGRVAFERTFTWRGPAIGGETVGQMKQRGLVVPPPEP